MTQFLWTWMQAKSVTVRFPHVHFLVPISFCEQGSFFVQMTYYTICCIQIMFLSFFEAFPSFCSQFTSSLLYSLPATTNHGATAPRNVLFERSWWLALVQPTSTSTTPHRKWFRSGSRERWRKSSENKSKQLWRLSHANGKAKTA